MVLHSTLNVRMTHKLTLLDYLVGRLIVANGKMYRTIRNVRDIYLLVIYGTRLDFGQKISALERMVEIYSTVLNTTLNNNVQPPVRINDLVLNSDGTYDDYSIWFNHSTKHNLRGKPQEYLSVLNIQVDRKVTILRDSTDIIQITSEKVPHFDYLPEIEAIWRKNFGTPKINLKGLLLNETTNEERKTKYFHLLKMVNEIDAINRDVAKVFQLRYCMDQNGDPYFLKDYGNNMSLISFDNYLTSGKKYFRYTHNSSKGDFSCNLWPELIITTSPKLIDIGRRFFTPLEYDKIRKDVLALLNWAENILKSNFQYMQYESL